MPAKTKRRDERDPKTEAKPKEGGKRGALKANRMAKRRSHYAANPARGARNKQRRLGKRLRQHPYDLAAWKRYVDLYGEASARSHVNNADCVGRKRAKRRFP